jgi:uncharacterized C2H2 Zn-finger protein
MSGEEIVVATNEDSEEESTSDSQIDEKFECDQCQRTFTTKFGLKIHLAKSINHRRAVTLIKLPRGRPKGVFLYHCSYCEYSCSRKRLLGRHLLQTHMNEITKLEPTPERKVKLSLSEEPKSSANPALNCPECGMSFKNEAIYNMHIAAHAECRLFTCFECNMIFRDSSLFSTHACPS